MGKEELIINKDNYEGYLELYKAKKICMIMSLNTL